MAPASHRLDAAGKALVRKASRQHLSGYFSAASSALRKSQWLAKSNRYRKNCIESYWRDVQSTNIQDADLTKYVAATAPTHIIDGFSFLSRGLEAALRGDVYSAIHFGYYAVMRAAMALLAAEGIGVFNNQHPVFVSANASIVLKRQFEEWKPRNSRYEKSTATTHKLIWPCLETWSKKADAGSLLTRIMKPAGIELHRWLQGVGISVPNKLLMQRWLDAWGVDLASTTSDRARRNLASYRPSELRPPVLLPASATIDFLTALWKLFEPQPTSTRFPSMEKHLLRDVFRTAGVGMPNVASLIGIGIEADEARSWEEFFGELESLAPLVDARGSADIDAARCHFQVLSRAALLLFVGAGASRQHFISGQISLADLKFWIERFGEDRLLWQRGAMPQNPLDTWADTEVAIQDIREWRETQPPDFTMFSAYESVPSALRRLSSFEAVTVWSLMP